MTNYEKLKKLFEETIHEGTYEIELYENGVDEAPILAEISFLRDNKNCLYWLRDGVICKCGNVEIKDCFNNFESAVQIA